MQIVDREGIFIGTLLDLSISKGEGQARMFGVQFKLQMQWNPNTEGWEDVSSEDLTVYGNIWMRSKQGKYNQKLVTDLANTFDWQDGMLSTLAAIECPDKQIQVTVETGKDQNGDPKFEVRWFCLAEETPVQRGGMKKASAAELAAMDDEMSASLRALIPVRDEIPA